MAHESHSFGKLPSKVSARSTTRTFSAEGLNTSSGKHLETHPLETALLVIVSAHLIFLPWALGTMRPWAQWISLGFAIVSFIVALLPRRYAPEHTGAPGFIMRPMARLVRFPIFWLGLALLGLVTLHGFNAAWEFRSDGRAWWMRALPHIEWLPSGVKVPFSRWGPWRMLLIYSSTFLTVCAVWIGLTRRRSLRRLLVAVITSGVALAGFGVAQRLADTPKIFWAVESPNLFFFGSFIYKNHAGAYLVLVLALGCALGAWYYVRGLRRMEKSNPSGVFVFLVACVAVATLISGARGATFATMGYLGLVMVAFLAFQRRLPRETRHPVIAVALLLVFGLFLKVGYDSLNSEVAWDRLRNAFSGQDVSVLARQNANKATMDALQANWVEGIGSGSYRFLFPIYKKAYPELNGMYWEHAHNDVLQFPLEFGIPGMLLILGGFVYWGRSLIRYQFWRNPLSASLVLGCVSMLVMAWGDFVFACPAVLTTWCVMWAIAAQWAAFERRG